MDRKGEIEFLPWYATGEPALRCDGKDGCGALVMGGDVDRHIRWHGRVLMVPES